MPDSVIATLVDGIRAELIAHRGALGLGAGDLEIEPILNWGGFVNRSFCVEADRRLVVKLSADPAIRRGLEQWRDVAALLESRYHAPRPLGWLDLPSSPFAGPIFEWIDGRTPARLNANLAVQISSVIRQLHADVELAQWLGTATASLATMYLHSYHDRFAEDLEFIAADPPPFISPERLDWMQREAANLIARVRRAAAFDMPAVCPVHNDLWVNNILIDRAGRWFLLDWDGLAPGDPLIDWVMLFGPSREHPHAATEETILAHTPLDAAERERLAVYLQASQLDWIIDPLADWVQAGHEPEHGAQVRAANELVHTRAIQAYRSRFGSSTPTD